jgi:hypothetical protein
VRSSLAFVAVSTWTSRDARVTVDDHTPLFHEEHHEPSAAEPDLDLEHPPHAR